MFSSGGIILGRVHCSSREYRENAFFAAFNVGGDRDSMPIPGARQPSLRPIRACQKSQGDFIVHCVIAARNEPEIGT